jgi:hypothetical protein
LSWAISTTPRPSGTIGENIDDILSLRAITTTS